MGGLGLLLLERRALLFKLRAMSLRLGALLLAGFLLLRGHGALLLQRIMHGGQSCALLL